MLPEHRISGILNASAKDRDDRIMSMIEDVSQSSDVTQAIRDHIDETARHWEKTESSASARSQNPAKSLLQSMGKIWPGHAQEIVATMLNSAEKIKASESFYNNDITNNIRRILERQEDAGEALSLDVLLDQTKSSERGFIKRALMKIRNDASTTSASMRDFAGDVLEEEFGVEKRNAEVIPLPLDEEPVLS